MRRIFAILFSIGLALFFVELALRLLGFGYNIIYRQPEIVKADYKIFCIGESTTWGIGAENPLKENYPKQLEDMLNNHFADRRIRCFFDQTIGQNTSEILLKLPKYIQKYQPHLIIFMVGVNNWWNLDKSNILLFNKNSRISNSTLKTLIFLDKFRLWKLFKWISLSLGFYRQRWDYWFPEEETVGSLVREIERGHFQIFGELAYHDTSEMIKICNENSIKVIICSYPIDKRNFQERIAEETSLPFVDNYVFF